MPLGAWVGALLAFAAALAAPARGADDLAGARRLLLTGHYPEARAAYSRLAAADSVEASIGLARCDRETGNRTAAITTLRAAIAKHPGAAAPHAELARFEFERGQHEAARHEAEAALAIDPDHAGARFVAAELDRVAGRLDEANEGYRWFVRYYNREQDHIQDPDVVRWVGLGAAQFARWNRNSGQFHFLVNTLFPDARRLEPAYWPAHYEAALLFIEKYNDRAAMTELDSALAINPKAPELFAARAWIALQQSDLDSARADLARALRGDPGLVLAHRLSADLAMVASGPREALPPLDRARALDPTDEETLGRLAAVYGVIDGLRDDPSGTRMGGIVAEATARNPRCGAFFESLASSLDLLRKYPHAQRYYEEARRRMPQLITVAGKLGLVSMRLGDEARADTVLREAFKGDPFNLRVKNTIDVLEVLAGYGTIETAHFRIRFDSAADSLLARYASRWLEDEVFPDLVKRLDYTPPGKSLFEIFSSARGIGGHGWFSMRMVGLPFIGTIGACAGKMVAITSPNDGPKKFNWARVMRHEFVHVLNLQQTNFNIPHWYTEALAVTYEGEGHPVEWDQALARRAAAGRLYDLNSIHLGFVRPNNLEDWTLAYTQAELYARYMKDTYGDGALAKMVAAYADNLDTPAALEHCFGVREDAFEKGYGKYVARIVAALPVASDPAAAPVAEKAPREELERLVDEKPRDALVRARLALAYLRGSKPYRARETALAALALDPKQQVAAYVHAMVFQIEGNRAKALEALRGAFDETAPDRDALVMLAGLTLDAKDYAGAERLVHLGEKSCPAAADWGAMLTVVYRATQRDAELAVMLERQVARDFDNLDAHLDLARIAEERKDYAAAGRWALEAIHIDVQSAPAHAIRARALAEAGDVAKAIEEYETAVALDPKPVEWWFELGKSYLAAGNQAGARRVLGAVLEREATHAGALELIEKLGR